MISYLEEKGIDYKIGPAKNIRRGWIGIQCPFPGCGDKSNHCGIDLSSLRFRCWVCGERGDAIKLICELERCGFVKAKRIAERFNLGVGRYLPPTGRTAPPHAGSIDDSQIKSLSIPKDVFIEERFSKRHVSYLKQRGFDPMPMMKKYGLMSTSHLGRRFTHSIVIPFYYKSKIVTFTTRDITGKREAKYMHLPDEESVIPIGNLIYNFTVPREKLILVEGVMDAWRIGDGAGAILGTSMTEGQILRLIEGGVSEAYILLDSDAARAARRLRDELTGIIPYVEVISMDRGDPADSLTRTNIRFLRRLTDG